MDPLKPPTHGRVLRGSAHAHGLPKMAPTLLPYGLAWAGGRPNAFKPFGL